MYVAPQELQPQSQEMNLQVTDTPFIPKYNSHFDFLKI